LEPTWQYSPKVATNIVLHFTYTNLNLVSFNLQTIPFTPSDVDSCDADGEPIAKLGSDDGGLPVGLDATHRSFRTPWPAQLRTVVAPPNS
jgi:hypothetical protein